MKGIGEFRYIPVVRTRDAELKGLSHLKREVLAELLPVVEFTQSRRSSKNASGSVYKCVEKISEILQGGPYIADLTSLINQTNQEISELLRPDNNFDNWVRFVEANLPKPCIPTVHLTLPFDEAAFREQLGRLLAANDLVAIRLPTSYSEYRAVLDLVSESDDVARRAILLFDAGYVEPQVTNAALAKLKEMFEVARTLNVINRASLVSSFPSSVLAKNYGGDENGRFALSEVEISRQLNSNVGRNITHGDYASIHPLNFTGTVTNWVPRVDVPLDEELYYYRYRRDNGGYVKAAKRALTDPSYKDMNCWGCENIKEAASGDPQGRSPAHWIAVRLNIHISRQVQRLHS